MPQPALAGDVFANATLVVTVRDAVTRSGTRARVKVVGPLSETRSTDSAGTLTVRSLPPGEYTVQAGAAPYKSSDVVRVALLAGETSNLNFDLAPRQSSLRSIGRVSTASRRDYGYGAVTTNGELRSLAENLNAALGNVPGVDLGATGAYGESQALYGLEGHDPNQTAVTLDGVPLNAPRRSFDASGLASELMASAVVAFGPGPGFSGGSIDYRTASPAREAVGTVAGQIGAAGSSSLTTLLRGSYGRLGYVFGKSDVSADGPFTGDAFNDWSGTSSFHPSGSTQHAVLGKLQYLLGESATIGGTILSSSRRSLLTCPLNTTVTPCGFGAGASSGTDNRIATLRLTGTRNALNYSLAAFRVTRSSEANFSLRSIAGAPYPASRGAVATFSGASARLEIRPGARDMVAASVIQTASTDSFRQTSIYDEPTSMSGANRQIVVTIDGTRETSPATRLSLQLSKRYGSAGSGTSAQLAALTRLTPHDSLTARLDVGSDGGGRSVTGLTTEPDFLNFICRGPVAFGRAATVLDHEGETVSERLVYTHAAGAFSFSATAFQQVAHGIPFDYPISASLYPPIALTGYLANANAVLHAPTVCPGAQQLTAGRLYLYGYLNDIDTWYRGLRITATLTHGPWRVDPYVSLLRATLSSRSAAVTSADSILRPGDQLFGVPYAQAGVLLDYKKRKNELALNYRYYSTNNSLGGRAFGTLDAASVFDTAHGVVTLRSTNVFDAEASRFARVAQIALSTAAGEAVPFVRKPFNGRRTSLEYSFAVGARLGAESDDRRLAPGTGQPTRIPRGLPPEPVSDPFALRNAAPGCDFETAAGATRLIAPIRAYYDAARKSAVPPALPNIPGAQLRYHAVPTGYELEISIQSMRAFRSLFPCLSLRNVDEDELRAAGFVGSATSYSGVTLLFTSTYGFILPTTSIRHSSPAYYQVGKAIPSDPFALTSSDSCTPEYRGRAAILMASMRATFEQGLKVPLTTTDFDVVVGTSPGSKPWVYLSFKSPFDLAAVLNCGHISRGSQTELEALLLGGAALPTLSFSPEFGFYIYQP
ncbi:MAG TPA: TonB-dependent receptor [Candidatus Elarobacter sp.]